MSKSSIFDYSAEVHRSLTGTITHVRASVHDHTTGAQISGSGAGGSYNLFHYGHGSHISLNKESGGNYSGFDYATGSHFSITVSGNNVTVYDYGAGRHYQYSL
jgi:hypothetical protein